MIRRLAEALLNEVDIPADWRETFFPTPPEVRQPPPPPSRETVYQSTLVEANTLETRVDELARRRQELVEEPPVDELARHRRKPVEEPQTGDSVARRAVRAAPQQAAPTQRLDIHGALSDRKAIQRAFVLGEILKPPKSLREEGSDPFSG